MLERALALAEPEGYVRVFTSEGQPMATLLTPSTGDRPGRAYLHAGSLPPPAGAADRARPPPG